LQKLVYCSLNIVGFAYLNVLHFKHFWVCFI